MQAAREQPLVEERLEEGRLQTVGADPKPELGCEGVFELARDLVQPVDQANRAEGQDARQDLARDLVADDQREEAQIDQADGGIQLRV